MPNYPDSLLMTARKNPTTVQHIQRHFAAFLAETAAKRYQLPAMPREQRKLAHDMAEHYGFTSQATGQEPQRAIQLFKTPRSAIPSRCAASYSAQPSACSASLRS